MYIGYRILLTIQRSGLSPIQTSMCVPLVHTVVLLPSKSRTVQFPVPNFVYCRLQSRLAARQTSHFSVSHFTNSMVKPSTTAVLSFYNLNLFFDLKKILLSHLHHYTALLSGLDPSLTCTEHWFLIRISSLVAIVIDIPRGITHVACMSHARQQYFTLSFSRVIASAMPIL